MVKLMYGHWLKTKRTSIRLLSFFLPVFYSISLYFYFFIGAKKEFNEYQEFNAFFLFFVISALFSLSFFIPLFCKLDKEASFFGNELRIGVSRSKLFLSKYFLVLSLVTGIEVIGFSVFSVLQFILSHHQLDLSLTIYFLLANLVSLMPMTLIYFFLALTLNEAGSIVAGIIFTLSGILLGTTDLGGHLWHYMPWVWGVRLSYEIIPQYVSMNKSTQYWQILCSCILLSVILLILVLLWYNRWEGKSVLEE